MEQLGHIALGSVLVLVVLGLRRISIALAIHSVDRVDWSKIRLPTFGWRMSAWAPRTKNSVLLSIAVHAALALIGTLFIVTKDIEHDAITVEWVKIPLPMRRVKTLEVKPVQPRIIPPRDLATHQVTPTPKPVDVKVAARRSFAVVRDHEVRAEIPTEVTTNSLVSLNCSGIVSKPGLSPSQLPKTVDVINHHTLSRRTRILLAICHHIHYNIIVMSHYLALPNCEVSALIFVSLALNFAEGLLNQAMFVPH